MGGSRLRRSPHITRGYQIKFRLSNKANWQTHLVIDRNHRLPFNPIKLSRQPNIFFQQAYTGLLHLHGWIALKSILFPICIVRSENSHPHCATLYWSPNITGMSYWRHFNRKLFITNNQVPVSGRERPGPMISRQAFLHGRALITAMTPAVEQEKPTNCDTKAADVLANCLASKL